MKETVKEGSRAWISEVKRKRKIEKEEYNGWTKVNGRIQKIIINYGA